MFCVAQRQLFQRSSSMSLSSMSLVSNTSQSVRRMMVCNMNRWFHGRRCIHTSLTSFSSKSNSDTETVHPCRATHRECWKCGQDMPCAADLRCRECDAVQPLQRHCDHFCLLNVAPTYDLDLRQLETHFRTRQKDVHPDRVGTRSEEEQDYAANASTELNVAYRTLQDPVQRANYILKLSNREVLSETANTNVDPSILMDVMSIREELDDSHDPAKLQELKISNQQTIQSHENDLSDAFSKNELEKAGSITIALQYYVKIDKEIDTKLEQLGTATNV